MLDILTIGQFAAGLAICILIVGVVSMCIYKYRTGKRIDREIEFEHESLRNDDPKNTHSAAMMIKGLRKARNLL